MYLPRDDTAKRRMGWWCILSAGLGLMCLLGASPSRATTVPDDRRASSAPVHADSAGAAPARETRIKPERTFNRMPPQARIRTRTISKGRHSAPVTLRGIRRGAAGNTDRVRALMNTQARGLPGLATGVPGLGDPKASERRGMPVPPATAVARNFLISGPRGQTGRRLGGAVVGRTNHNAVIDGTQLRRKL